MCIDTPALRIDGMSMLLLIEQSNCASYSKKMPMKNGIFLFMRIKGIICIEDVQTQRKTNKNHKISCII